jgi:hypothetical protein
LRIVSHANRLRAKPAGFQARTAALPAVRGSIWWSAGLARLPASVFAGGC